MLGVRIEPEGTEAVEDFLRAKCCLELHLINILNEYVPSTSRAGRRIQEPIGQSA